MSKYVPPHRRNASGASSSQPTSAPPSSSAGGRSSGSRFQGLREDRGGSRHQQHPHQSSQNRGSWSSPSSKPGGGARTNSRFQLTDPLPPAPVRQGFDPHRSSKQRDSRHSWSKRPPVEVAFFGDSFVRLFGLIEHPNLEVHGLKGASAKGLGREGNENRSTMENYLAKHADVKRLVCSFGSVDVHLSYYYKKYVLQEGELDFKAIAYAYVDFIASLSRDNLHITIVGIYLSTLDDAVVGASLVSYGSLTEEFVDTVTQSEDAKLAHRQARVLAFNQALKERCEYYQQEWGQDAEHGGRILDYKDLVPQMTKPNTSPDNLQLADAYKDVSDHNIHIVWETTLLLWMQEWKWLEAMAQPNLHDQLQKTLKEYFDAKPWAERVHVTQQESEQASKEED